MKKLHAMVWLVVLGFCSLLGGCMAISAQEDCNCVRHRDKFAEQVAQKVLEKQQQQQ